MDLAQLVERLPEEQSVGGSIPSIHTNDNTSNTSASAL